MRAITYGRFGAPEVLELRELPKPAPKAHEVLIRVRTTTVTAGDWRCRSRDLPKGFGAVAGLVLGFTKPRQPILGSELSGEIESVGGAVTRFKSGDPVFAFTGVGMGCYVEYKCLPEDRVVLKPPSLGFEEAAALSFGGTTALGFLRKAGVKSGDKVLVNGASGAVGTAAVQLARHFGAEVTGVCGTGNLALVGSLGAHKVIDYTKEDFARNGETYDLIVETAGTAPFSRSKTSLREGGRLLVVLGSLPDLLRAPWQSLTNGKKVIAGVPKWTVGDLRFLAGLAESGAFKPIIDRRYPFEQMVEAHRYVDAGHKRGNVVITV
ncbi:MAG: NAD(P)-dependent alcohol dehydrogenase [Deltaproteobacteria bacterium]|nr:NAD(P)-dependent alcohol dehydrogenase [Deltaproteobacteria bacterium]